ncbi:neuronal cell adhesion molecule [Anabrus simplex]|uniref:neuronal cell adhesion molecule n=1 Tax=Anabrus simplex TaxID=316456 RepID=UPI0035A31FA9
MGPSPTSPDKKFSEVIEPVHCLAWPDLYCHTLNGLQPDSYYEVTVQPRNSEVNDYGPGKSVTDITKESAPGAPTSLEVVNRTQTGMLIQWGPPWFISGVLRSFILNVEETDSSNSSNCCQYFPIQELPIQTEQQLYRLDVGGLKPSSTFTFSISAKTVTLGPSLNISASTPPEPPTLVHPPRLLSRFDDEPIKVLIKPEGSYPGLRSTYLLLVLTPDDNDQKAEFWDWELQAQIEQLVNANFYAVAEFPSSTFTQEKSLVLGTGTIRRNGTYSPLENRVFLPGSYRAGLALILDYCGATSVGLAVGDSFTV